MTQHIDLDLAVLFLVYLAFFLFISIEVGGVLRLPGFHTVSYLAHHYLPLRIALVVAVLLFAVWLFIHTGRPVPN